MDREKNVVSAMACASSYFSCWGYYFREEERRGEEGEGEGSKENGGGGRDFGLKVAMSSMSREQWQKNIFLPTTHL